MKNPTTTQSISLQALLFACSLILLAAGLTWAGLAYPQEADWSWGGLAWGQTFLLYCGSLLVTGWLLTRLQPKADPTLFSLVALLSGLGLVLVSHLPSPYPYIEARQMQWLVLGEVSLLAVVWWPGLMGWLQIHPRLNILLGLTLLILTATLGEPLNGNGPRISLSLGSFSFQPAELIKLLLVIYLAGYLHSVHLDINRFQYTTMRMFDFHRIVWSKIKLGATPKSPLPSSYSAIFNLPLPPLAYIWPMLLVLALALVTLGLMGDLGATLILSGIFLAMIYIFLKRRIFWSLATIATVTLALGWLGLQQIAPLSADTLSTPTPAPALNTIQVKTGSAAPAPTEPTTLSTLIPQRLSQARAIITVRLNNWRDPWGVCQSHQKCPSYQTLHSLHALAAGGVWGAGPGLGHPTYIPAAYTDLAFAALVEEWGLVGGGLSYSSTFCWSGPG